MPEIAGPGSRRKRTATACQTCREMKSKVCLSSPSAYRYICLPVRRHLPRHTATHQHCAANVVDLGCSSALGFVRRVASERALGAVASTRNHEGASDAVPQKLLSPVSRQ